MQEPITWQQEVNMADDRSPAKRSLNMSHIRSRDTSPELKVRSMIHRAGYRYRLHVKEMPGKPDIVMPRYRTAIFVNGCFWHRHLDCRYATMPKTNIDYWQQKFKRNVDRDQATYNALRQDGWSIVVIWECQTRDRIGLSKLLAEILPPRISHKT